MAFNTPFPYVHDTRLRNELMRRLTIIEKLLLVVYPLSGTTPEIEPLNGHLQVWTLTANSTPDFTKFNNGEYLTLQINGTSFSVTWPVGMKWIGGSAPTLDATNPNIIVIWKTDDVLIGHFAGVAS